MMTYNMKHYQHKGWKALTMFFVMCFAFAGTTALTSCSSDDDPFFTVSENDDPRILNTDLADQTLDRLTKLNIEIKVTPIKYTTVTWLLDGVQIAEGTVIDQTLPIGVHVLKIVATTTVGKSTSRTLNITVTPATSDPYPAASDIHETLVKQGTTATMHGSNMSKVAKVIIGETSVDAVYNEEGDYIEYTVPDLADGVYALKLQDKEGVVFEAGTIELNHDPAYPVGGEVTLWEGSFNVTWDTPFKELQTELINHVKVGTVLRAYVSGEGQGTAASAWWTNLVTGGSGDTGRGDTPISGDMVLEFVINETSIQLLQEQDGFFMVGNGYTVKKITVETSAETTLWEGSFDVTWDAPFKVLQTELINHVKVGTILRAYVSGEGQGTAASAWWTNLVTGGSGDTGRGDTPISGDMVLEYVINETSIQLLQEQDGFFMVGNGYTLKKITVE